MGPDRDPDGTEDYEDSDALIDAALAAGDPDAIEESRPVDRFRRSAAGTVVAAGLLGLRDALEGRPEREEPAIVTEAPSTPHDAPIDVQLDFDHPERSRVVIRRPPAAPAGDDRPTP